MRECTPVLGPKAERTRAAAPYRVSCVHTFGRLLGFLRPYKRGRRLVARAGGAGDGVHRRDPVADRAAPSTRSPPATATACARWRWPWSASRWCGSALSVLRRLVAGQVSLAIEYDLRTLLYAHLQKLELGFFAGQQTGQLMSRATVDLSSVRFFLGYGLVFILQIRADDRARRGGDVLALARAGGAGADPGAVRGRRGRRATGAARGRRCRRSSSGSPRSPRTSRRTSPACAWSRPSRPSRASSSASAARSRACSTSR